MRDRKRRMEHRHGSHAGATAREFQCCGATEAITDCSDPACVNAWLRDQRLEPRGNRAAEPGGVSNGGTKTGVDLVHAQQFAVPHVVGAQDDVAIPGEPPRDPAFEIVHAGCVVRQQDGRFFPHGPVQPDVRRGAGLRCPGTRGGLGACRMFSRDVPGGRMATRLPGRFGMTPWLGRARWARVQELPTCNSIFGSLT